MGSHWYNEDTEELNIKEVWTLNGETEKITCKKCNSLVGLTN